MTDTSSHALLSELTARGFIHQTTGLEALSQRLTEGPLTLYTGFDATAPSFHVGNLVIFMTLKWFHRAGHRVIVLLGGGTTQVGDPSDKKSARPIMTAEAIETNLQGLKATIHRLFPDSEGAIRIMNNREWLETLGYMAFLKDVGRHFSVNRMVHFEFVRNRLENNLPLSFLELNYMLLQAYDFLKLYDTEGCILEIGGGDQWANILSGVELVRRIRGAEAFAMTCPILTTASGAKMGKTAQGAVWLRGDLLSPYDFWQFWRNVDDRDVARFLRMFTFLPLNTIEALTAVEGNALNKAKKTLADQVTTLIHGVEVLQSIHATVETFFGNSLGSVATDKVFPLSLESLAEGVRLLDLLQTLEFVSSKAEARRLIRAGAIKLNDAPVKDESFILTASLWSALERLKLTAGTKKHIWLVREGGFLGP